MIAIINYGVGNLSSISNMFKKIGVEAQITSDPEAIEKASKVLLPGVGSFDYGMARLNESGLRQVIEKKVLLDKVPVLGICLGMQMITKGSEEGTLPGLGWIDAYTQKFSLAGSKLKVPHMGWNEVKALDNSSIFKNMNNEESRFYFVHSYHVVCNHRENILAETTYGYPFISSIYKENIYGTQFHPEKSHKFGMQLLENFSKI